MTDDPLAIPESHVETDGVVHRPDGLRYLAPRRALAFLGLLRAAEKLETELSRTLQQKHAISLSQFEVLLYLAVFSPDGELPLSFINTHAPLSQSRVSRMVAELETRRLVQRHQLESDRRGVTVAITPEGLDLFKDAQDTHLTDLEQRLFSRLSAEETGALATITTKILEPDTIPMVHSDGT